jgi:hypothetical protein
MVINLFPTSYDSLKETILGLCVLACFAIRSVVEVVEFSKHYVECFMDDENHISKIHVKKTIAPFPTTSKVIKKQSIARDGRAISTSVTDEDKIMHQKTEVLEECIRRLSTCEKVVFHLKFWFGCCGIW